MLCQTIHMRAVIWVMILSACMMSYMLRVNMSINLIAMVKTVNSDNTTTASLSECAKLQLQAHGNLSFDENSTHERLTTAPDCGDRYEWNSNVQGMILGSFFWGYIVSSMPGGLLAEKFGATKIIGVSIVASGLATILIPIAASFHYGYVIFLRIVLGLLGGVVYPALHNLIAKWSPPVEKGKFIGALMGGTLGTVLTWPILGTILVHLGWQWAFFLPGGLSLLWSGFWFHFVADSPDVHSRISDSERMYIVKCITGQQSGNIRKTVGIPPYKRIFTSVPFWGLALLHFGNLWGLYLLLTAGPKFMSEILGFNLGHSGILASLPYLARMILGFAFGSLGDYIRKKKVMSVTNIRKSFIVFSHVIPGFFLFGQTLIGCDQTLAVTFLTLALGMNGASTVTNLQNSQDLSPNYAGTLYGIVNCIGGTTGFITPMLTGFVTQEKNGLFEWHQIFWIGAAVYILCGFIFCVLGSGEQQPWNVLDIEQELTTVNANGNKVVDIDLSMEVTAIESERNPNDDTGHANEAYIADEKF